MSLMDGTSVLGVAIFMGIVGGLVRRWLDHVEQEFARIMAELQGQMWTWVLAVCTCVLVLGEVRMWIQGWQQQTSYAAFAEDIKEEVSCQREALINAVREDNHRIRSCEQLIPTPLSSPQNLTHRHSKMRLGCANTTNRSPSRYVEQSNNHENEMMRKEQLNSTKIRELQVSGGLPPDITERLPPMVGAKSAFRPSGISVF